MGSSELKSGPDGDLPQDFELGPLPESPPNPLVDIPNPVDPPNLFHEPYNDCDSSGVFVNRPLITPLTERVEGGVYCPLRSTGTVEAIVVDIEKDDCLRGYVEKLSGEMRTLKAQLEERGKEFGFDKIVKFIAHRIAADFPYETRMLDGAYVKERYLDRKKHGLGTFMFHQDMVCRHMGLLTAVIIDYLKNKGEIPASCEVRFMDDEQEDTLESRRIGHAYVVTKCVPDDHLKSFYYVLDSAGEGAVNMRQALTGKREISPNVYRYLFGFLRLLLQLEDTKDDPFIAFVVNKAQRDPNMNQVLEDLRATQLEPQELARLTKFLALARVDVE